MDVMLNFQRFAKSDYRYFGQLPSWTTRDAKILLASFEMESKGEFGVSDEIFVFNAFANLDEIEGIEKLFHKKWGQWDSYIWDKIRSKELSCVNTPSPDCPPISEGQTREDMAFCYFHPSALIECLSADIEKGIITLDLDLLRKYLKWDGNAQKKANLEAKPEPVMVAKKEPSQPEPQPQETPQPRQHSGEGAECPVPPKNEYFKAMAEKKGSDIRDLIKRAKDHLIKDYKNGCDCPPMQAAYRLMKLTVNGALVFKDPRKKPNPSAFIKDLQKAAIAARRDCELLVKGDEGYEKPVCPKPGHRK